MTRPALLLFLPTGKDVESLLPVVPLVSGAGDFVEFVAVSSGSWPGSGKVSFNLASEVDVEVEVGSVPAVSVSDFWGLLQAGSFRSSAGFWLEDATDGLDSVFLGWSMSALIFGGE